MLFVDGKIDKVKRKVTTLTSFFNYNSTHDEHFLYEDMIKHCTLNATSKKFTRRKNVNHFPPIGRIITLLPNCGDAYYLRILLNNKHSLGATSFQDILTLRGKVRTSFKRVCKLLGLLQADSEWNLALEEGATIKSSPALRQLFCTIVLFYQPSDSTELFRKTLC
jgi:hypothetical protein